MGKLVVLNIVEGDFDKGFPVFLGIATEGQPHFAEAEGKLPPALYIRDHYKSWQSPYLNLVNSLRSSARISVTGETVSIAHIKAATKQLKSSLNDWLNSGEMHSVTKTLFKNLKDESEEIRFIIKTKNSDLQRLPWHLWSDFFNYYRRAEVALSLPLQRRSTVNFREKARILAVFGKRETLGNTNKIDTDKDWEHLQEHLQDVELIRLVEPKLEELDEQLWEQTPDMLFFAGHSASEEDGATGRIDLNQQESITISNLEYALRRAVRKGLQLAIFNSCDGLGIAQELASLEIPQIIVMREPVPDEVAQKFLQRFLQAFVGERTLCRAVRRARERIYALENKFPGATWLPVIFQNPAEAPLTGREFRRIATGRESHQPDPVGEVPQAENQSQLLWLPTRLPSKVHEVAITCSKGHQNLSRNRFCLHCGESLSQQSIKQSFSMTCSRGHENPAENIFCRYCGELLKRETNIILPPTALPSPPETLEGSATVPQLIESSGNPINFEVSHTVIGSLLRGRYKVIRKLGHGAFGETYLAQDMDLPGKPLCAVKLLKPLRRDPFALQTAIRLFDREAQVLYRLGNQHDQIPRLLAHFEENEEFYLVQEFIDGNDLSKELIPSTQWSQEQVIAFLQDVLKILEFAHQQNVIHRDIKPANLIRRASDSKIVLIDFGAVKEVTTLMANIEAVTVIGTPGYMPNEQHAGNPKFNSDIYSLGMICIQAITGNHPRNLPKDPELIWSKEVVSPELAAILDKMVCSDFSQRYQSAKEVLQALKDKNRILTVPPHKPTILSGLKSLLKGFRF